MKKRRQLPLLFQNCKGSAIVTVLVAVAFIAVLGALLLNMTYTGFLMKTTEQKSTQNFYDAETAMNEIRMGVQLAVSDSISAANTKVLEHYSADASETAGDEFQTYFKTALLAWKAADTDTDTLLYNSCTGMKNDGTTYSCPCYSSALLEDFISDDTKSGAIVNVTSGFDDTEKRGELSVETGTYTLKDITVTYFKDGYQTSVTSDIQITVPSFSYELSNLVLTTVQNYAIIAKTSLTQNSGGNLTAAGNIYAGKVDVSLAGNSLTLGSAASDAYKLITPGTVTVANGASMTVGSGSSVWAKDISVGLNGTLALSGETYLSDDLTLDGDNASASISGKYYGFGDSATDSSASSSISVNGHGTTLQLLSDLRTLMLAGYSFIGTSSAGSGNSDVLTGESVSVKSNQIAYLIPSACITDIPSGASYAEYLTTNPAIFPSGVTVPSAAVLSACVDTASSLWSGGGSLNDYGASVRLAYVPVTATGQTLVYFYMSFDTAQHASNYFKDYFSANTAKISQYMALYTDSLTKSSGTVNLVAGNATYYDTDGASLVLPTSSTFSAAASRLSAMYANQCATLSTSNAGTGTAYDNVVDTDAVATLTDQRTLFYDSSGAVVSMISTASQENISSVLASYPSLKVLVCTGDVQADKTFAGLIISGGNVQLKQSVTLDREGVSLALNGTTAAKDKTMLDYLKIGTGTGTGTSGGNVSWDMSQLVIYQNWSKN